MKTLHPTLFVLRHGESTANVAGVVVSDPARGCSGFGLSERGRQQVCSTDLGALLAADTPVRVVSSDFLRAWETAKILVHRLRDAGLRVSLHREPRLRERNFGPFEGTQGHDSYARVWAFDARRETHPGVEAVGAVWDRAREALQEAMAQWPSDTLVAVAHGDVLQILLAGSSRGDPWEHRSVPHLENAEIRPLGPGLNRA